MTETKKSILVTDFTTEYKKADFWKLVDQQAEQARQTVKAIFMKAEHQRLSTAEAVKGLDALFIDSHRRIKEYSKVLAKHYPTRQFSANRLENDPYLWWIDHYTAGVSKWSTLSWFSSKKSRRKGRMRYHGASTHFVLGYQDYPFYIIPLCHGAWHVPARNKDSISIEMVNAGHLKQKNHKWCYWPRGYTAPLPQRLIADLPPVRLPQPFRGAKVLQPFTTSQLRYNILLKRIILAALPGKLLRERFSQHQEWSAHKLDMGPLWPFKDVNDAAFDSFPVAEYSLLSKYDLAVSDGTLTETEAETLDLETQYRALNPEYGHDTPTNDDDLDSDAEAVLETAEVQRYLNQYGYRIAVDGIFGPNTKKAVAKFQAKYNIEQVDEERTLKIDGIPGPNTCRALTTYEKE